MYYRQQSPLTSLMNRLLHHHLTPYGKINSPAAIAAATSASGTVPAAMSALSSPLSNTLTKFPNTTPPAVFK